MGLPKASLPFGPELMLQRVVRLLSNVVHPIVVVAAAGQQLPQLPSSTIVTHDERDSSGPLEGLRAGLVAIRNHAAAAYVASCDSPLLSEGFVRCMIAELGEYDAAVPYTGQDYHPLAATYHISTVATIERRLRENKRKMSDLFQDLNTNRVPLQDLRACDPDLLSLLNINTPDDYIRAVERAGLQVDPSLDAHFSQ